MFSIRAHSSSVTGITDSREIRTSAKLLNTGSAIAYPGPRAKRPVPKRQGKPLRDRVGPGVRVLFVGINPGLRSAAIGHHFAGYSTRFWKLLFESGLVPEPIGTEDDGRLPEWGFGITNLVARATPGIDTLRPIEYVAGKSPLARQVRRWSP